jgi:hypothetical protein
MKRFIVLMMVVGGLLTGCVVEERGYGYRDGARYQDRDDARSRDRDRDRDGVTNRYDRRPDDPRRD